MDWRYTNKANNGGLNKLLTSKLYLGQTNDWRKKKLTRCDKGKKEENNHWAENNEINTILKKMRFNINYEYNTNIYISILDIVQ